MVALADGPKHGYAMQDDISTPFALILLAAIDRQRQRDQGAAAAG
jgi:hypothetical protein